MLRGEMELTCFYYMHQIARISMSSQSSKLGGNGAMFPSYAQPPLVGRYGSGTVSRDGALSVSTSTDMSDATGSPELETVTAVRLHFRYTIVDTSCTVSAIRYRVWC